MTIPNGGIANFLHLILQSYGYSAFQTILIGLPQAVLQAIPQL
jgi:ACS family allantoate permease-like MFS transporter